MSLIKIISNYTKYNHWANEMLIQWLRKLDATLLYKNTLSSYGSIDLTIQHMKHAQLFWLTVINEKPTTNLDESIILNAAERNMEELLKGSKEIHRQFKRFTEEDLLKPLHSNDRTQVRYECILHVVNHNTYHRGQLVTMSRCLGVMDKIPSMDYEVFLWTEQNKVY